MRLVVITFPIFNFLRLKTNSLLVGYSYLKLNIIQPGLIHERTQDTPQSYLTPMANDLALADLICWFACIKRKLYYIVLLCIVLYRSTYIYGTAIQEANSICFHKTS